MGRPRQVVELGCKFTKPVVVPAATRASRSSVAGTRGEPADGRATIALERHLRRREGARRPQGRRSCLRPACADHTTLRLGGPAAHLVEATTEAELVDAVRAADDAGEPVLVLAGGSNLVVADEGFAGTVVAGRHPRRHPPTSRTPPTPPVAASW